MLSKITFKVTFSLSLIFLFFGIQAQELKASVSVVASPQAQAKMNTVEQEVITVLKRVIEEFLNNTKWTNDNFEIHEKINCSFQLTVEDIPSAGYYRGSLIVNATRPIFNASITTPVVNFKDDYVEFAFNRDQIMQYAENQYRDNLTSTFAFWAYMILGYDYDSFSLEGGTKFFTLAQQIATLAQNSGTTGWSPNESKKRNRFFIIDNHLNSLYKPLREAYYNYHRMGLDMMFSNPAEARANVIKTLKKLEEIQNARFGNVNLQIFTLAKREEFVNLFSKAENGEKTEVVAILKKIDPSNGEKYDEIMKL